jgi:hypothetical protein
MLKIGEFLTVSLEHEGGIKNYFFSSDFWHEGNPLN